MAEGAYLHVLPRDVSRTKLKRCAGIRRIELQRCEEYFEAVSARAKIWQEATIQLQTAEEFGAA